MQRDFKVEGVGVVEHGSLGSTIIMREEDRKKMKAQYHLLSNGTPVKVTIALHDPKKEEEELRTKAQNRYYHALLDIICDHTGDDHMYMHERLKIKLLGRPYIMDDKEYIVIPSTTSLKPKAFADYLEKVFRYASEELELVLPDSSQYY